MGSLPSFLERRRLGFQWEAFEPGRSAPTPWVTRELATTERAKGEARMRSEARSKQMDAVAAHPLAELLECPPLAGNLLTGSAETIELDSGEVAEPG